MANRNDEMIDGWGRPLDYSFDAKGIVTLRSLGADKQMGGDGDNRDMTGIFASRDANGHWHDEIVDWMHDPYDP